MHSNSFKSKPWTNREHLCATRRPRTTPISFERRHFTHSYYKRSSPSVAQWQCEVRCGEERVQEQRGHGISWIFMGWAGLCACTCRTGQQDGRSMGHRRLHMASLSQRKDEQGVLAHESSSIRSKTSCLGDMEFLCNANGFTYDHVSRNKGQMTWSKTMGHSTWKQLDAKFSSIYQA